MKSLNILLFLIVVGLVGYITYDNFVGAKPQPSFVGTDPEDTAVNDPTPDPGQEETVPKPLGVTPLTKVIFYEGNGCSQDVVQSVDQDSFTGRASINDEARSVLLEHVPAGTWIAVYDSPDKSENDDYAGIQVVNRAIDTCIRTFEQSRQSNLYQMTYNKSNGLDGKVSYIEVQYP